MTKAELKYYISLNLKKNREEEKKFLIEGEKLISEALAYNFSCEAVFYTNAFYEKNSEFIFSLNNRVNRVEQIKREDFVRIADTKNPQEVIGVFVIPTEKKKVEEEKIIAALESINDPGNLGTILRNCDWFGVDSVLLNSNCAEIYNPKVIRSSAGSLFHIGLVESNNFVEELESLKSKNYKIVCADLSGENIYEYKTDERIVIVFANEANGPSAELLSICDIKITIPKKGKAESLNVANASAVILSELTK